MKISLQRDHLLKVFPFLNNVVERRQTLPILSHVMLSTLASGELQLTTTDLEQELRATIPLETLNEPGEITVSARKLFDIARTLPDNALIAFETEKQNLILTCLESRFVLLTLSAGEFPHIATNEIQYQFSIQANTFRELLNKTEFCVAEQDIRQYLNGLNIQLSDAHLRTVATDGHRLAIAETFFDAKGLSEQFILPKKSVTQLLALLMPYHEELLTLSISKNHLHASIDQFAFYSKLLEGSFPKYQKAIPPQTDNVITIDRDILKDLLQRAAALCQGKNTIIRLEIQPTLLRVFAENPEYEAYKQELPIAYTGKEMEVAFNVQYLLDVLSVLPRGELTVMLTDSKIGALIQHAVDTSAYYVVMPMRL